MRSRWGYLIGLLFVGAAIVWVVVIGLRFVDNVDKMPRIAMPGVGELTLPEGDITFYAEPTGAHTDVKFRCKLVGDSGEVALERPSGSTRYSIGDHTGASAFTATLPKAGSYRMTCASEDRFAMAAGHIAGDILRLVIGGIVLLGIAVAMLVVTFVRRRSRDRVPSPRA